MALMRLAAKFQWLSVLSFHAAVLDRIEAGLASWGDDFMELERFNITESDCLPLATKQQNQSTACPPGFTPKTYCKEWYWSGTCSNQSHQVGIEHVCAYCKLPDHTITSCPTWPATTNASLVASPSSAWPGHQADTDNVKFPSSLQSSDQITTNTNTPVSSVNISCSSPSVSIQADCASPSDKSLPHGQLNLSASHSISAVIRHVICSKHTQPNAFGTRIVVPSCLNLPAWQACLTNYHDSDVVLFLARGWPGNNCLSSDPAFFDSNHSSAINFVQTVDKDETKHRIVLDLSFPPGCSVNDGIPKNTFLNVPFHLTLPRSADFVNIILSKGPGSFLCKKDLKRADRQIPVDPKDYTFLGYRWRDNYYFDLVLPFELRSATMTCQHTTTAIAYMCNSELNYACINYVDDFGGMEKDYKTASTAFLS